MTDPAWLIAADDLPLWDECRRCFYLALAAEFPRPAASNGSTLAGSRLLAGLHGMRSDKIADGVPAGLVDVARYTLRSAPLAVQVPDRAYRCVIRGELDTVLRLDGNALGLAAVVIGAPNAPALSAHARRLHAWAHAFETPELGTRHDVQALGVLAFEPETAGPAGLSGAWRWTHIERDDASFFGFLAEALSLLAHPAPPGGTALCPWCVYRDASRRTGY